MNLSDIFRLERCFVIISFMAKINYENKRNDYENPFLLTIVLNWDVLNESQKVYCKMFMRKFTQIATF